MADTGTVAFKGDLEAFAEQMNISLGLVTKKIVLDLHASVTALTPVDTGRLRAAWVVGVGESNDGEPDEVPEKVLDQREDEKKKGNAPGPLFDVPPAPDVSEVDGTQPVFLTNNLVYAEAIEDGHSKQAPSGMLKVAVANIEAEFAQAGGTLILSTE